MGGPTQPVLLQHMTGDQWEPLPVGRTRRRAKGWARIRRQLQRRKRAGSVAGLMLSFRLSPVEVEELLAYALAQGVSMSEVVRGALEDRGIIGRVGL